MKHKHRVLPGHMGGEYAPGNVVEVEVTQCDKSTATHPMWHYANWKLWGKLEDKIAWRGLSGLASISEVSAEAYLVGARKGGASSRDSGLGWFSPEAKEANKGKGLASRIKKDPETQRKAALKRAETWRGGKHTEATIEKIKASHPKGTYSNKGRTPESRQVITMKNLDGRTETHPNWEWREMGVRYDRAGVGRTHDKGWQFPHCPLEQAKG